MKKPADVRISFDQKKTYTIIENATSIQHLVRGCDAMKFCMRVLRTIDRGSVLARCSIIPS